MTDDRNNPPAPPPAAPPPLAEPPPMAPPPPQSPPAAQAPPAAPVLPPAPPAAAAPAGPVTAKGSPLPWVIAGILGLSLIIFLVLYFTGVLDRETGRSGAGSSYGTSGGSGFGTSNSALGGPLGGSGTVAPPSTGLSMSRLAGTWGPRCPGSRDEAVTFTSTGSWTVAEGGGSYTVAGDTITLYRPSGGGTFSMRWEMLSETSARVTMNDGSRPDYVYRCGSAL